MVAGDGEQGRVLSTRSDIFRMQSKVGQSAKETRDIVSRLRGDVVRFCLSVIYVPNSRHARARAHTHTHTWHMVHMLNKLTSLLS